MGDKISDELRELAKALQGRSRRLLLDAARAIDALDEENDVLRERLTHKATEGEADD